MLFKCGSRLERWAVLNRSDKKPPKLTSFKAADLKDPAAPTRNPVDPANLEQMVSSHPLLARALFHSCFLFCLYLTFGLLMVHAGCFPPGARRVCPAI